MTWPAERLAAADAAIENYVTILDVVGLGGVLRDVWQQMRPKPSCDCLMNPHHRWNCPLTPIWAQTMRDLGINPWTVVNPPPALPGRWAPAPATPRSEATTPLITGITSWRWPNV